MKKSALGRRKTKNYTANGGEIAWLAAYLKKEEEKMTRKLLNDEHAQAFGFDFLIAIGIFMGAFLVSYYMLSHATTAYYGESAAIYPVANRVSEILIKDSGEPADWDSVWTAGTYTTTKRIGLSDRSTPIRILVRTEPAKKAASA